MKLKNSKIFKRTYTSSELTFVMIGIRPRSTIIKGLRHQAQYHAAGFKGNSTAQAEDSNKDMIYDSHAVISKKMSDTRRHLD